MEVCNKLHGSTRGKPYLILLLLRRRFPRGLRPLSLPRLPLFLPLLFFRFFESLRKFWVDVFQAISVFHNSPPPRIIVQAGACLIRQRSNHGLGVPSYLFRLYVGPDLQELPAEPGHGDQMLVRQQTTRLTHCWPRNSSKAGSSSHSGSITDFGALGNWCP